MVYVRDFNTRHYEIYDNFTVNENLTDEQCVREAALNINIYL